MAHAANSQYVMTVRTLLDSLASRDSETASQLRQQLSDVLREGGDVRDVYLAAMAALGGTPQTPTPAPSAPAPAPAPQFPTTPSLGTQVDTAQSALEGMLGQTQEGGDPAAMGFPLFRETFDMLLRAEQLRQSSIDQAVSLAQLFTELERVSPTRAADLAVNIGLESPVDLSFLSQFAGGATPAGASGGLFGGNVGGQTVALPQTFSGRQLSFLQANPNVARIAQDVSSKFGLPDIFSRSVSSLIPTSSLVNVAQ